MKNQTIFTDKAPAPIGPYSQAIRSGDLLFTAGQIGLGENGALVAGGVLGETRRALENLMAVLEAGGSSLQSVVKTTIFMADLNDFPEVNAIYAEYFSQSVPARSTVEVARLPKDARIEIEAIARIPVS